MNKKITSDILREYENKRKRYDQILIDRKSDVFSKIPKLFEIDMKLRKISAQIAIHAFDDINDVEKAVCEFQKIHTKLTLEKEIILSQNGYDKNYLSTISDCPICFDSGYVDTHFCACVSDKCKDLENSSKSSVLGISNQSFDDFNFNLYCKIPHERYGVAPYDNALRNFGICKEYAYNFDEFSKNLLFIGAPGLSKTFLSTSIANVVSNSGYSVIYDTAINIFANYENQKFSNFDQNVSEIIKRYSTCDLLIIDDLGTEMITSFTISALYSLLNNRIMSKKPMIINTNYSITELLTKYQPAIASRLEGEFRDLKFFGDDVRKILKNT